MRDGAVGQAALDRRAVRLRRRIHQDEALVALPDALIGPARRISRDAHAGLVREARVVEKIEHRAEPIDAFGRAAAADEMGDAPLLVDLLALTARVMSIRSAGNALPARSGHSSAMTASGDIVDAEFGEFICAREPIKVGMHQREARQVVALHQGEGRARHFDLGAAREIVDQRAHKRGLAGTEIARERDKVARLEEIGDIGRKLLGRLFVASGRKNPASLLVCVCISMRSRRRAYSAASSGRFGREREDAYHGGALARNGLDPHRAMVKFNERAHDREPEPGPAVRRAARIGFEQFEHLVLRSGGMPGPRSLTVKVTVSGPRAAESITVSPGGEKPTALDRRLNKIWRIRRSSATKLPMSGGGVDFERDVVVDDAVLHAFGGRVHGRADVDRLEVERHGAGVDRGEVEDVVDDGEQRVARDNDVAEIFVLPRVSGPVTDRRGNARSR